MYTYHQRSIYVCIASWNWFLHWFDLGANVQGWCSYLLFLCSGRNMCIYLDAHLIITTCNFFSDSKQRRNIHDNKNAFKSGNKRGIKHKPKTVEVSLVATFTTIYPFSRGGHQQQTCSAASPWTWGWLCMSGTGRGRHRCSAHRVSESKVSTEMPSWAISNLTGRNSNVFIRKVRYDINILYMIMYMLLIVVCVIFSLQNRPNQASWRVVWTSVISWHNH